MGRFAPVLFGLVLVMPLAAQQPPAKVTKFDRGLGLTMLSNVKADLKENYYDKTFFVGQPCSLSCRRCGTTRMK